MILKCWCCGNESAFACSQCLSYKYNHCYRFSFKKWVKNIFKSYKDTITLREDK
jgi:hypothetical protein